MLMQIKTKSLITNKIDSLTTRHLIHSFFTLLGSIVQNKKSLT